MANINTTTLVTALQQKINALTLTEPDEDLISLLRTAQVLGHVTATNIETELTSRIENASATETVRRTALLSVAANLIESDRQVYVNTAADLPTNASVGSIYYVNDVDQFYIKNQSGNWVAIQLDNRDTATLFSWGKNNFNQLGSFTTVNRSSPIAVRDNVKEWISIDTSKEHNVAISYDGKAYAWGKGSDGELGRNSTVNAESPILVQGGFTDWKQLSAGNGFSLGIRTIGTAYSWGNNTDGQLGHNTTVTVSSPLLIVGGITDWKQLAGGGQHSIGLSSSGTVYAWGLNSSGQLGLYLDSANKSSPTVITNGVGLWQQVAAGTSSSYGLWFESEIYSWGNNSSGQLGTNQTTNKVQPALISGGETGYQLIKAGDTHAVALRSNGTVHAWGNNNLGQLGINTTVNRSSPTLIVGTLAFVDIAAGGNHTAAINNISILYSWGSNSSGELGDNTTLNRSSPVSIVNGIGNWVSVAAGTDHSIAIRTGI